MADASLNAPIKISAIGISAASLPTGLSPAYQMYILNQALDFTSVAGKANDAGQGAYDAQVRNDEQDIILDDRLSSQTGILFKGAERQYLKGLTTYLDQTRRAARAGTVTPTGQELFQVAVPAGVATDIVGTGGVGTAAGLSYGAVARFYESKAVRNAMLRLANTKAGTPGYERALNQAAIAARPLIAPQITE